MKIVTPVSSLFREKIYATELARVSDSLEARPDVKTTDGLNLSRPVTHIHFSKLYLDPNFPWKIRAKQGIRKAIEQYGQSVETVSFHLSRDVNHVKIAPDGRYIPAGRATPVSAMKRACEANFGWLRSWFSGNILLENNNYYPTGAYDWVSNPRIISEFANQFADGLLLDIAHAIVSADNLEQEPTDYLGLLSDCSVYQLHLSRPTREVGGSIDSHSLPDVEFVGWCEELLGKKLSQWPPLTVEYYHSAEELIGFLRNLRAYS